MFRCEEERTGEIPNADLRTDWTQVLRQCTTVATHVVRCMPFMSAHVWFIYYVGNRQKELLVITSVLSIRQAQKYSNS